MPILGNFPQRGVSIQASLVEKNDIFLDCRGHLAIEDFVRLGFGVKIITASHNPNDMVYERPFPTMEIRSVIIHRLAWICSFALLYNCEIGEGALVGSGAVVKGVYVPDWHAVEGNPAVVTAKFDHHTNKWVGCQVFSPPRRVHYEATNQYSAAKSQDAE